MTSHKEVGTGRAGSKNSRLAALFGLQGEGWMRHANAASVWTRFAVVPLLTLSVWSWDWIGWYCLIPVALSLLWMGINPLFFKPPRSTKNWASRAVLGERIWSEGDRASFPAQFQSRIPTMIATTQAVALLPLAYGLIVLDPIATVCGVLLVQIAKLWFLDRMVLLFEAMKSTSGEYASWDY